MLLECLPSGRPSCGMEVTQEPLGQLTPKPSRLLKGFALSSVCKAAVVFPGWAQQKNKGLNLLRLKCSETEPEWLCGILVFSVQYLQRRTRSHVWSSLAEPSVKIRLVFQESHWQDQHAPWVCTAQTPPPPATLSHPVPPQAG